MISAGKGPEREMSDNKELYTELRQYLGQKLYPLHMPGHKRRLAPASVLPYEIDLTEVPGTDDLHSAGGILRSAMDRTAELYDADRTWYLVNGSTCGNLAAIFAATRQGGEIIAARNCHRSVLHALELRGLHVHWALPTYDAAFELCGCIRPETIADLLARYPKTEAVVLTVLPMRASFQIFRPSRSSAMRRVFLCWWTRPMGHILAWRVIFRRGRPQHRRLMSALRLSGCPQQNGPSSRILPFDRARIW